MKQRRLEKINTRMQCVPVLPKAFDKWIDDVLYGDSRYVYYRRINKMVAECLLHQLQGLESAGRHTCSQQNRSMPSLQIKNHLKT